MTICSVLVKDCFCLFSILSDWRILKPVSPVIERLRCYHSNAVFSTIKPHDPKFRSYARVIAGDLSPTMLEETRRRCVAEGISPPELVRCDSSRLPFASNSLDAIHAGAAMHCWPRYNIVLHVHLQSRIPEPSAICWLLRQKSISFLLQSTCNLLLQLFRENSST